MRKNLWIISKCDASEAYSLLDEQIKYFRLIIVVILIAESVAMYFISRYMTKPLEKTKPCQRGNSTGRLCHKGKCKKVMMR